MTRAWQGPRRRSVRKGTVEKWIETRAKALGGEFARVMATCDGDFAQIEELALRVANALVRNWLETQLQQCAQAYGDEVRVGGHRYRRHSKGTVRYHSLCGPVEVTRETYRQVGVHNGPTVVPLELDAGIVENATPALAVSVLQGFATMPLRHYEEEMRAAHRTVPSRSTLERIAKRTGAAIRNELPVIEPKLRAREKVPRELASISVGIDRTTIPMAEPSGSAPDDYGPSRKRRPPAPISMAYRMAYVGTVALNDATGSVLTTKRVSATAGEGPELLMQRLAAEVEQVRRANSTVPVVVIQDGAPELWNLVETWFGDLNIPIAMKLLDRYHLEEHLAQWAELIEPNMSARWRLLGQWRNALDRSDTAIVRICEQAEARMYDCRQPVPDRARDPETDPFGGQDCLWVPQPLLSANAILLAEGHLSYCRKNRRKMRYQSARKRGLPIGSGPTEGACKSVIGSRFKRSGQRWFEHGASPCLHLRTLHLNGRLRGAFAHYSKMRRDGLVCEHAI